MTQKEFQQMMADREAGGKALAEEIGAIHVDDASFWLGRKPIYLKVASSNGREEAKKFLKKHLQSGHVSVFIWQAYEVSPGHYIVVYVPVHNDIVLDHKVSYERPY